MSVLRVNYALITILTFGALMLSSCGSAPSVVPDVLDGQESLVAEWPAALPVDYVQPWEELNAQGYVVPSDREYFGDKGTSAINALSEFMPGVEYETAAGDTASLGEGLRLTSGSVGSGTLSCATYRLTLGGVQPGVISADVNLRPRSDDSASTYWLGLSDYGAGCWQWHGPFGDSHVRLSTTEPGADYLSPMGNTFVCVVAHDGAQIDIVGIGANVREASDTTPPAAPTGLVAAPYAGALMLEWHHVAADDLAGYRVYWAKQSFGDPSAWYVQCEPYLEGANWHMLPTTPERTYACITALDISGNESKPSEVVSAYPLADEPPVVQVTTDVLSGMLGTQVTLTATGAVLYDWDLNGDGIVEVTGDTTGTGIWTFDAPGLWRPTVKGVSSDGTKAACAAVSLIITGNTRPVASATASPQSGVAPLTVAFTGTAEDGEDEPSELTYAWDFDGNGVYEPDTNTLTPTAQEYTSTGIYGVKFRVTDTQGAWDVDTIPVQVLPAPDPENLPPTADVHADPTSGNVPLTVDFDAGASSDTDGSIVEYAWDLDGSGSFEEFTEEPTISHVYTSAGSPEVRMRVTDNDWARTVDTVTITVNVVGNTAPTADVAATPTSGDVPLDVDFDASTSSDPDGTIVRYDWDLNGDGNYELYDGGDTPSWTYNSAGVYTAKVRVTDDDGAQGTDTVTITVNVPGNTAPTASVSATPDSGEAPLLVDFDASASNDPDGTIVRYDWDFDGDGNYDSYSTTSSATHTYTTGGKRTVKLMVTDDVGAQDTETVEVSVGWNWVIVTLDSAGTTGNHPSLVVVNGQPAVSYEDFTASDLNYVRANDSLGLSWGAPVTVDSGEFGRNSSMAIVNGRPAISYGYNNLKYVRASNVTGSSWGSPVTIDTDNPAGCSLAVVDGRPAVFYVVSKYINPDWDNIYKYIRADDANGSTWGTPTTLRAITDLGSASDSVLSLRMVNGNPAIAYAFDGMDTKGVWYRRADDATGSAWGSRITIDPFPIKKVASMAIVAGNPAILYFVGDVAYRRANDADGSSWDSEQTISGDNANWVSLAVVNGRPVAAWEKHGGNFNLRLCRADDSTGSSWGQTEKVDQMDSYSEQSIAEVEGHIAIAYYDDGTKDLKYAICLH